MYTMLRRYRLKTGMRQIDLSIRSGICPSTIAKLELNYKIINYDYAEILSGILDCDQRDLVLYDSDYKIIGNKIDPDTIRHRPKRGKPYKIKGQQC